MANIKHYDITNLKSKNANYNIIFGRRNNGKSYQIKKTVLTDYFENHKRLNRIIEATNKLNNEGYKFEVLFIGDGQDHKLYEETGISGF